MAAMRTLACLAPRRDDGMMGEGGERLYGTKIFWRVLSHDFLIITTTRQLPTSTPLMLRTLTLIAL